MIYIHQILYGWSRRMRWAGHVARVGDRRGTCRVMVGRPEGKTALGRPRCRLNYNIKIDLTEAWWSMDWFYLAQEMETWQADVHAIMNHWGLQNAGNFLNNERPVSVWRRILFHGVNWSGIGTVFTSRSSVFPYQYHSTVATWSLIHPSPRVLYL